MNALTGEIIELLNKKQEAAFEVMFSLYYPRLVYFAKEYVSYEDAKSMVQDAFVSYWEKNPTVLNEYQLQSYLYTSVKNNCLMRLNRDKVKKKYLDKAVQNQNQVYASVLKQLDTTVFSFQEIESIIEKTLDELPPKCREVFVLSRFEGKRNHEIAEGLNVSVKAVEAQITKALKIFKVTLKDYLPLVAFWLFVN